MENELNSMIPKANILTASYLIFSSANLVAFRQIKYTNITSVIVVLLSFYAFQNCEINCTTGCLIMKEVKYKPRAQTKIHPYELRQVAKVHWGWDILINTMKGED